VFANFSRIIEQKSFRAGSSARKEGVVKFTQRTNGGSSSSQAAHKPVLSSSQTSTVVAKARTCPAS
jgi:hypothetical protein